MVVHGDEVSALLVELGITRGLIGIKIIMTHVPQGEFVADPGGDAGPGGGGFGVGVIKDGICGQEEEGEGAFVGGGGEAAIN